jgi:ribosomal protein S12 methylthiotransferase
MKTFYIESLGCAKNLVDSEAFAHILRLAGYKPRLAPDNAHIVLLNTCGFLESAFEEAVEVLLDFVDLKEEGRIRKIIVTGCAFKRFAKELTKEFHEVDHWIGLKDFEAFASILGVDPSRLQGRRAVEEGFHAYLRISDGCGNHCSYCAIPSIRGEMVSVPIEKLVEEAQALANDPLRKPRELIVIAQDTCNYGMDIYGRRALPELLEKLHAIEAFDWIRVMYMHPDHFDPAWLDLWERLPRLLPYFEIPIQHSVPSILESMGRVKADQELEELFATIRARIPHAVLRTTIMSGYPGESYLDFTSLQRFIRDVKFTYMGVFAYSREEGTPAAWLPKQVKHRTASAREIKLLAIQNNITNKVLESFVGKEVPVLVDRLAREGSDIYAIGRAWFQAPDIDGVFYISNPHLKPGTIVTAVVDDVVFTDFFGSTPTTNPTNKGFT